MTAPPGHGGRTDDPKIGKPLADGVTMRFQRLVLLLIMLAPIACSRWSRPEPPSPAEYPSTRNIKVWAKGRTLRLHNVHFRNDTLIGVPSTAAPDCDSCRVYLPIAQVDSVQADPSDTLPIALAMVPIAIVVLLLHSFDENEF